MGKKNNGIAPENIFIACVVENREPYMTEAYYLFKTLVQLGGRLSNSKKIAYFVGEADAESVERLASIGVIVKVIEPVDKRCPHANKLAMLADREEEFDILLMLDCDTVIAKDFMDLLSADAIMAKPVDADPLEMKDWEKLYGLFGMRMPKERFRTTFQDKESVPYFNSGVISVPAKFTDILLKSWKKNIDKLFVIYEKHPEIAAYKFFTDQFAFALSLQEEKLPFRAMPLEMNTPIHSPIHRSFNPESLDPYILHYHHLFTEKGINVSSYQNINRSISKVNETLSGPIPVRLTENARNEKPFDNREFWDNRYKGDLNLGSGVGSRGEILEYKKRLLRKFGEEIRHESVLDVGCGDIELTKDLPFGKYHGIDVSEIIIERNRKLRPERQFSCGDLTELSKEKDLSSDMVICFDVLIHQPNLEKYRQMVEKMVSLTKVTGVIAGFELPPRGSFGSAITFYHEPVTETLKRAGARNIKVIGNYRGLSVVRFSAENAVIPGVRVMAGSKAICILGMHRSGTSTITRAVNLLGAYLGEEKDLMKPAPDNPEGFWERDDFVAFDDKVLNHWNLAWDSVLPMPKDWHRSEEAAGFREELKGLITQNFGGKKLWAWKDPRTTVLFELWKDVLQDLGVETACLIAVRSPLDVARSLEKRNGFSRDRGFGTWFNYNLKAFASTIGMRRAFLSYDNFLTGWEKELKRCMAALDVPWPEDDSGLKKEMSSFLHPDLRHSFSGLKELKEQSAPQPVIELYRLLEEATNGKTPDDLDPEVIRISAEFESYSRFYAENIARLSDVEKRLRQYEIEMKEKELVLADKDRQIGALAQQMGALTQQIGALTQQIGALKNSVSWKITAPIRSGFELLRKKQNERPE